MSRWRACGAQLGRQSVAIRAAIGGNQGSNWWQFGRQSVGISEPAALNCNPVSSGPIHGNQSTVIISASRSRTCSCSSRFMSATASLSCPSRARASSIRLEISASSARAAEAAAGRARRQSPSSSRSSASDEARNPRSSEVSGRPFAAGAHSSGHQVIRGHQRSSEVINGHQSALEWSASKMSKRSSISSLVACTLSLLRTTWRSSTLLIMPSPLRSHERT